MSFSVVKRYSFSGCMNPWLGIFCCVEQERRAGKHSLQRWFVVWQKSTEAKIFLFEWIVTCMFYYWRMKATEINLYLMLAMFRYASRCEEKNDDLLREKIFLITSIVLTRCHLLRHKVTRRSNFNRFFKKCTKFWNFLSAHIFKQKYVLRKIEYIWNFP